MKTLPVLYKSVFRNPSMHVNVDFNTQLAQSLCTYVLNGSFYATWLQHVSWLKTNTVWHTGDFIHSNTGLFSNRKTMFQRKGSLLSIFKQVEYDDLSNNLVLNPLEKDSTLLCLFYDQSDLNNKDNIMSITRCLKIKDSVRLTLDEDEYAILLNGHIQIKDTYKQDPIWINLEKTEDFELYTCSKKTRNNGVYHSLNKEKLIITNLSPQDSMVITLK
jgi:hypothetical protein